MAKKNQDILVDNDYDDIHENGDFAIGDTTMQDVEFIIQMNQGELKSDPVLGCNLVRLIKSNVDEERLRQLVRIHLSRDGKDYEAIKNLINPNITTR